jgi:hypothetical protein
MLEAENVEYDIESRLTETTAGSCVIRLTSLSTTRPEFFNFRSGVWFGKPNGALYSGFTLDVGNLLYQNGRPASTTRSLISAALFSSNTFNSRGVLYDVNMQDGGRGQMTQDPKIGTDFLSAVYAGDYYLSFSMVGVEQRTYHVIPGPSGDVLKGFQSCTNALFGNIR